MGRLAEVLDNEITLCLKNMIVFSDKIPYILKVLSLAVVTTWHAFQILAVNWLDTYECEIG